MPTEQQQFQDEVKKIMQQLQKKGLLAENTDINAVSQKVTEKLMSKDVGLTLNDVKNIQGNELVRNSVALSCMAEANPKSKFDYTMMFKPPRSFDEKEFKEKLNDVITNALVCKPGNKRKLTEEEEKALRDELQDTVDKLADRYIKTNKPLAENDKAFDLIAACVDLASENRAALYDADPHTAGAVQKPVPPQTIGNQLAFINLASGLGDSKEDSAMKAEPGIPDPNGLELTAIESALASAGSALVSTLEETGLMPNDTTPRPSGPGGIKTGA